MLSAPESVPNCPTKQTFAFNLDAATAVFAPYIKKKLIKFIMYKNLASVGSIFAQ